MIALVTFGGGQISTVAAVLVYRIVSFWGYLPVGWIFWGGLTWHNRRADQTVALSTQALATPATPTAPVLPEELPFEVPG